MTGRERIAQAVADPDWQKFRLSMKGQPTDVKLDMLVEYYEQENFSRHTFVGVEENAPVDWAGSHVASDCDVCIRVDNYIKALCRGGQLQAGVSIDNLLELDKYIKR